MSSETNHRGEYGFFSKDVAHKLKITPSTLRRWSIEMEKAGYTFTRNDQDQRIYFQNDINCLKSLQQLLSSSVPLNNAVRSTVAKKDQHYNSTELHDSNEKHVVLSSNELRQLISEQLKTALEEERETFLTILESKMNNEIERRDRQLLKAIQENREQKNPEIAAAVDSKKRSGFWKRLFSKT